MQIKIQNFGPIQNGFQDNDGWLDVRKCTIFIGNQGSGKSSVAKLISVFSWIEKVLIRGDFAKKHFTEHNRFRGTYCAYHRVENYFFNIEGKDIAHIEYKGQKYHFTYTNAKLEIKDLPNAIEELTQVMYIPAERNLVSVVKNPTQLKEFPQSLIDFVGEFNVAKQAIKIPLELPINKLHLEYDKLNDIINIKGSNYKVRLTEASSGLQSLIPMFLVSQYYAQLVKQQAKAGNANMSVDEKNRFIKKVSEIWEMQELSDEQKRSLLSNIAKNYNKSAFINIVEEPEQNLFPASQKEVLYKLLELNNYNAANKLILTTHSPYLISYLSLAVEAKSVEAKLVAAKLKQQHKPEALQIDNIVPLQARLSSEQIVVYQIDEATGKISNLKSYKGLPSDENYLNEHLAEINEQFSKLLEIEDLCQ
ncbi:MAG: AAA family ATPase [Bacteroidales bacterium]